MRSMYAGPRGCGLACPNHAVPNDSEPIDVRRVHREAATRSAARDELVLHLGLAVLGDDTPCRLGP